MYQIAVADSVFPNLDPAREVLSRIGGQFQLASEPTPEAIMGIAKDADAILVTYAKITGDMIRQLTKCRIISRFGIGVDNVDIPEATKKGIVVTKVPDYCIDEVSDHTMALLLAVVRKIPFINAQVHGGHVEDAGRRADPSAARHRAGAGRVRPHSAARRAQGAGIRHEGHCLRPVRADGRCSPAPAVESVDFPDAAQDVGLRVHPQSARARDEEPVQRRRVQADEADGVPGEHRSWTDHRRGGACRGAGRETRLRARRST